MRAISSSKSHPPSVRYSKPRPTGGASEAIVSNAPDAESTVTASSVGISRIRCWVVMVPAVSA